MNEGALPELPGGWVWTKLREVLDFVKGKKPKNLGEKSEILTTPYINIEAFENKIFNQFTDGNGYPRCEPNDILIVWDGARCGLVGKGVSGVIGSTLAKLVCSEINSSYLYYFLQSKYEYINKRPRGVGIPHVEPDIFWNINFPLSPLPEQRRIVAKIEELFTKLDAGMEALKKTQAQLKRYRQSVLKAACEGKLVLTEAELARAEGRDYEPADVLLARILKERREKLSKGAKYKEPAAPDTSELPTLPEGWGWASIDQISQHIVDCLHSTPNFMPEGKYCIDTNCIEQGKILFEKARFVSEETYNERVSRLIPQTGDILFAREGTIGTAVIVPPNIELCLGQRMMMFRAANGVIPSYFMWALQSQIFEKQWKAKVSGSTVPHVNIGDIKLMALALPPTLEQRRIVAEVERRLSVADEVAKTVEQSLAQAQRLRQSILKKAFEGKLVAQDSEDEPASMLLERIQMERSNWGRRRNKEISTKIG